MFVSAIILGFILPAAGIAGGPPAPNPTSLQDPTTKVIFYLESDKRHVAAISPEGKLLWCVEVIQPSTDAIGSPYSISIEFTKKDALFYEGYAGGGVSGYIDKTNGVITQNPTL